MENLTDLIDRYIAMWNETDAERRRALIAGTWTEDANYLDPVLQGDGPTGIDAMVRGFTNASPSIDFAGRARSTHITTASVFPGSWGPRAARQSSAALISGSSPPTVAFARSPASSTR